MLIRYNYIAVFYNKGIEYTIFKNKLDISRKKNQQPFTLKWNVQFYNFFNTFSRISENVSLQLNIITHYVILIIK